jgi:hypothetical protein
MALSTFSTAPSQADDATFRVWGKAISDALTAVGVAKSGDTGQIDWAAVVTPAAGNTSKGYEIRVFADALQATVPIFIKIEFGSGAAATSPALWITVGIATDGAGTLTGAVTTRRQLTTAGNSATTYVNRVTGETNRVALWTWTDAGVVTYAMQVSIERTHDAAGADTNEGFTLLSGFGSSAQVQLVTFLFGTGVVSTETLLPALLPSVGTGASGAAVALYPIFPTKGVYLNPLANVLIAFQANVTPGTPISFTYYGATKAFIPLNNNTIGCAVRGAVAGTCYLVRNE